MAWNNLFKLHMSSRTFCTYFIAFLIAISTNSRPVFSQEDRISPDLIFRMDEGEPPGYLVGAVPVQDGYTYRFVEHPAEFIINSTSGEIRTSILIDRELLSNDVFDLFILGESTSGPINPFEIRIIIEDVNDNSPIFPNPTFSTTVSEFASVGKKIDLETAVDPDRDANGQVANYNLIWSNSESGRFSLEAYRDPFNIPVIIYLKVTSPLDRESESYYEFIIQAEDNGSPPRTSNLTVFINVTDANDNPPVFEPSEYSASVNESIPVGSTVLQVTATDRDIGPNGEIIYFIDEDSPYFEINGETGILSVARRLQYDSAGQHSLTIKARDLGTPTLNGRSFVTITVIDENDHDPEINFNFIPSTNDFATVEEGAAFGQIVALVTVLDADQGDNGDVDLTITRGNEQRHFVIQPFIIPGAVGQSLFQVKVIGDVDRERMPEYNITLVASDNGSPRRSSLEHLIIKVTDSNDHAPQFQTPEYRASLSEGVPVGSFVESLTATDQDYGVNAEITYSIISGNDLGWFSIDPDTGLVTTSTMLDRETSSMVSLNVSAIDHGPIPLSNSTTLIINILDENDEVPQFTHSVYNASVPENLDAGFELLTVSASDSDLGQSGEVRYRLFDELAQQQSGLVTIDEASGKVYTAARLDRETLPQFEIEVEAFDLGDEPQRSTAVIRVIVLDENDNQPIFYPNQYIEAITENEPAGTFVVQVTASDADAERNGRISFSITSGNRNGNFQIETTSGTISTARTLDREQQSLYMLGITARDGGGLTSEEAASVQITVTDTLDNPPTFESPFYPMEVEENVAVGTEVGMVAASSADLNTAITYSIFSGDPSGVFEIGTSSGILRTQREVDREETSFYSLVIYANGGSLVGRTAVNITVQDVNDNSPVFPQPVDVADVVENWDSGRKIYQAVATDQDSSPNGDLVYELIVNPMNRFGIEYSTGWVFLNSNLQETDMKHFDLQIEATDLGTPQKSATLYLTVNVRDVNNHSPEFTGTYFETEISESTAVNNQFFNLMASDEDQGANGEISYTIYSGNEEDKFGIFPNGMVYVKKFLDREQTDLYSLKVSATDGGVPAREAETELVIRVLDENDNRPIFENTTYSFQVREELPAGAYVGTVHATDSDIGANGELRYSFATNQTNFAIRSTIGDITTLQTFDRENMVEQTGQNKFEFDVLVNDNGRQPYQARVTVKVVVADFNDHSPVFMRSTYQTSISELTPNGTNVLRVAATDDDIGDNSYIVYSIADGNDDLKFSIGRTTGQIELVGELDREDVSSYTMTIRAQDAGQVPKTATAQVQFTILDENDHPPMFVDFQSELEVTECLVIGEVISTVHATDVDIGSNGDVRYRISHGNVNGAFRIDPDSGIITVAKLLDHETRPSFTLNITAFDQGALPMTSTETLNVVVRDCNDNSPVFPQKSLVRRIDEEVSIMHPVVTLTASDPDSGINGQVKYSILSQDPAGDHFAINADSGQVYTNARIDYEDLTEDNGVFTLVVQATDQALPIESRGSSTVELVIFINDINDNAPVFMSQPAIIIPPDATVGSTVTVVQAQDPDEGQNGQITFSVIGRSGPFEIDPNTGTVTLTRSVDAASYVLTLNAADSGVESKSTRIEVTVIAADDSEDGPIFTQATYSASVSENESVNTPVVTVQAGYGNNQDGSDIQYFITMITAGGLLRGPDFVITQGTGRIFTNAVLDRESLNGASEYVVTVFAVDLSSTPPGTRSTEVRITVDDVNDSPPVFTQSFFNTTISETAPSGTVVTTVTAIDADTGSNAVISYSIVSGNDGSFYIQPTTGRITSENLDRERKAIYRLGIRASDGRQQTLTELEVIIVDVNDNDPKFTEDIYSFSVPEDQTVFSEVESVLAVDPDDGLNGEVTYSVVQDGAPGEQVFQLDPRTGAFTLLAPLDFEKKTLYYMTVAATDSGTPPRSSQAIVYFNILDVNDNAPVFLPDRYSEEIVEDVAVGTSILTVVATDEDSDKNAELVFTIKSGDPSGHFIVHPNGTIMTIKPLDREDQSFYNLELVATDQATDPTQRKSSTAQVSIIITDINDNPPQFVTGDFVIVPEDIPIGTVVMTVVAEDADVERNSYVEYSLAPIPGDPFIIGAVDGNIRVFGPLDRESIQNYTITVHATDKGSPPQSNSMEILVQIADENDNDPVFKPTTYHNSLVEGSPIGLQFLQVFATDIDEGENAMIRYSIYAGNFGGNFAIDSAAGILSVAKPLDRETYASYSLTVRAQDMGAGLHYDDALVTIDIDDVNDNAPEFDAIYAPSISENNAPGAIVVQVSAKDLDAGNNGQVTYRIEGEDYDGLFTIESGTGIIRVQERLDHEAVTGFILTVTAQDAGTPSKKTSTTMRISVLDENDNDPVFSAASYTATIQEEAPISSSVIQITATDMDSSANLRYQLNSDIGNRFTIHPISGWILTAGSMDRESQVTYDLVVTVTDGDSKSTSATVTVVLEDVNDNAPKFAMSSLQVVIPATSTSGTFVAAPTATDADIGDNARLTYSITSGNTSKFKINHSNGVIATKQDFSSENGNYVLVISVQDLNPNHAADTMSVSINFDASTQYPVFTSPNHGITFTYAENTPVDELVVTASAMSPKSGIPGIVRYYVAGGNFDDIFAIDDLNGELKLVKELDYEMYQQFSLWIEARDSDTPPMSSYRVIEIRVTDINDNVPQFTKTSYGSAILEEQSAPQPVVQVTAIDDDSGLDGEVVYSILSGNTGNAFAIDTSSGLINTDIALDRESVAEYTLTVVALDRGNPAKTATTTVDVVVADSNDNRMSFTNLFSASVPEDLPLGSVIITLTTSDPDVGANAKSKFRIIDGNQDGLFDINQDTGEIYVNKSLDREDQERHQLRVMAFDDYYQVETDVTIRLTDVNDIAPVFDQPKYDISIPEKLLVGSFILPVSASDLDSGSNSEVTYHMKDLSSPFSVNEDTGYLTIKEEILYIKPDSNSGVDPNLYKFEIFAIDKGIPTLYGVAPVSIQVFDANDHAPVFTEENYFTPVPVNAAIGDSVIQVLAKDLLDEGLNAQIQYEIINGNGSTRFDIDQNSGYIKVRTSLQADLGRTFQVVVQAEDLGKPIPMSDVATVDIMVTTSNDHPPVFSSPTYDASVSEDLRVGGEVVTITASDPDSGLNGQLVYTITSGNEKGLFTIGETSAKVSIAQLLDYETSRSHTIQVTATDQGWEALSANYILTVAVQDVDDNPPVFNPSEYEPEVPENSPSATPVVMVMATDADTGLNAEFTYSIIGGDGQDFFSINKDTGVILTQGNLDYEGAHKIFALSVMAANDDLSKSSVAHVTVHLTGVNEYYPRFFQKEYDFSVSEGATDGTVAGNVLAGDADQGEDGEVFYLLIGSSNNKGFMIDAKTGQIQVSTEHGELDRETTKEVVLSVLAKNAGEISGDDVDEAQVTIQITDANDPPVFQSDKYEASISEAEPSSTYVTTVTAIDYDQKPEFKQFSYTIMDGNIGNVFSIDGNTGVIRTSAALDREQVPVYRLTVGAVDTGVPSETGTTEVIITLEDVNDNGPVFPPGSDIGLVPENEAPNYVVMTLTATDPDLGSDPNKFTYTLLPSQDAQSFNLNGLTGVLKTTQILDREQQSDYYLEIESSDGETPAMIATSTIHIIVEDVNDNPSSKRNARIEVKAFQSVFPGGTIGIVKPIDADTADVFECEITAGDLSAFSIQPGCALQSILHTTESQYTLDVTGTDGQHPVVVSNFAVQFEAFNNDSLTNSLTLRLNNVNANKFLTDSYDLFIASVSSFLSSRESLLVLAINEIPDEEKLDITLVIKSETTGQLTRDEAAKLFRDHKATIESQSGINIEMIDFSPCTIDPCLNGGACQDFVEVYQDITIIDSVPVILVAPANKRVSKCECPPEFHGPRCERQEDLCDAQPCQNGGTCINDAGGFACICTPGFSGSMCEINVNECASFPCENNGICRDQDNGFDCECQPGYSGTTCQDGPCATQPCFNGGTCIEEGGSYRCECGFGERGDQCEFTSVGFEQGSFMELPTLAGRENTISMQVATTASNALLVYNHDGRIDQTSNFLALEIVGGKLRLSFDLGSGMATATTGKMINDGMWHNIEARRYGQDGEVLIFDSDCPPTGDTSYCRATSQSQGTDRDLSLNNVPLSLGGVRSIANITDRPWQVSSADFSGCIRDLYINGQLVDMGSPLDQHNILEGCPRDVETCSNVQKDECGDKGVCVDEWFDHWCQCQDGLTGDKCDKAPAPFTFGSGSYVEYQIKESYRRQKQLDQAKGARRRRRATETFQTIQMAFRTGGVSAGGLLLYVASGAEFTIIQVLEDSIQYSFGTSGISQGSIAIDDRPVSDWDWHNITVSRQGNTVNFVLDGRGSSQKFGKLPHDFSGLDVSVMSLGGVKDALIVDGRQVTGFEGCIENFALNGQSMPLDGANEMFDAVPSENTGTEGCSTGPPCMPNPCPLDEVCLEDGNGFTCTPAGACLSDPCKNGGKCVPYGAGYLCDCPNGYNGETCAAKITGGNSNMIVIIVVVFVVVLLVLLIVCLLIVRHYRIKAAREKKHMQGGFDPSPSVSLDAVDNAGYNVDTFDDATMIGVGGDSKMHMVNPVLVNGSLQKHPDIIDPNDLADATQPDSSSGGEHDDNVTATLPAEHYDIENASSIAPSDIDVAYHYRHYHDQERKMHPRRSPNPLLMHLQQQQYYTHRASPVSHTSSRQALNNLSHRSTPNHMSHNIRGSPNIVLAHSTPMDGHDYHEMAMQNQYPMMNLSSKETMRSTTPLRASRSTTPNPRSRSTTPNHRSITPSHRSTTPSHRSLASPVHSLHSANSVHSMQSELRSVGHHSDVSSVRSHRSRTKSPLQVGLTLAAQQALAAQQQQQQRKSPAVLYDTKVPLGLTVEEVARLNTARPDMMVGSHASTIDNLSLGSDDRGLSPPPVTHTLSHPSPHLLEAPSSDDDTNDSFTCSEVDSEGERLPPSDFDPGSIILSRLAEVENENEYSEDPCSGGGHSEPGSLSTLFMSDDENMKPGRTKLNGSLKWEDFLNWGPNFNSFAGVFKDIAELQDTMANSPQTVSPQTILAPSPQTTITLEQTEEEFV